MVLVILDAQIDKAANQLAAAGTRIREYAGQPGLDAKDLTNLAVQAERLGLTGEAEAIYRAARPPVRPSPRASSSSSSSSPAGAASRKPSTSARPCGPTRPSAIRSPPSA